MALLLSALALSAVALPAAAAPGGNSAAAKTCQKDGYTTVQGSDGERFKNTGQCVSYAARGGTLSPIPPDVDPFACPDGTTDLGTFDYTGKAADDNNLGAGWTQTSGTNDAYPSYADETGGYYESSPGTVINTILLLGSDGEIAEDDVNGLINRNSFSDDEPVPTIKTVRFCGAAPAA